MKTIYLIRGYIGSFIKRFDLPIRAILKFVAYFWLFRYVSGLEGFQGTGLLASTPAHVVLAIVSLLLPSRCGVLLAILLGLYNMYQVTMLGAAVAVCFFVVIYIMTARLFPDHAYMLVLVPICLHYKLYLMIPLIAGMYLGIVALIPLICGAIMNVLLTLVPEFLKLKMPEKIDALPKMLADIFKFGFNQFLHNDVLIFMVIVFTGVVVLVGLLRKMQINYGAYIALGAGTVLGLICLMMGKSTFGVPDSQMGLIMRSLFTFAILALAEFMHIALNYQATQKLSFEDDDYQYYVTVIPKIEVGKPKREVKNITETGRQKIIADTGRQRIITDTGRQITISDTGRQRALDPEDFSDTRKVPTPDGGTKHVPVIRSEEYEEEPFEQDWEQEPNEQEWEQEPNERDWEPEEMAEEIFEEEPEDFLNMEEPEENEQISSFFDNN